MNKKILYGVLAVVIIILGAFYFYQKSSPKTPVNQSANDEVVDSTKPVAQMANPASANCVKVGGTLTIEKRADGGEYGLCYFEDNRACEEWALIRGECPVGGVKTTGFDNIAQKYCVWSGGETSAVPNSNCTFKDGLVCTTEGFYNGECPVSK